jgi:hypothetical protein
MKFANPRTVSMGFIAQPENMRSNQWNLDRIRNQPQRLYVYLSALGKNYRRKPASKSSKHFGEVDQCR